jgi:hypothetical protein
MNIVINYAYLREQILEIIGIENLNGPLKKLKAEFDFNPFDQDGDQWETPWDEFRHNVELVNDVILATVQVLERAVVAGRSLSSPEKLEVAVAVLDEVLVLPWYAEMFDGPILKLMVSQAVALLNSIGWEPSGEIQNAQGAAMAMGEKIEFEAEKAEDNRSWDL